MELTEPVAASPTMPGAPADAASKRAAGSRTDSLYFGASLAVASSLAVIFFAILAVLVSTAWPAVTGIGLGFFTGTVWNPGASVYGAVPFVVGTVLTTAIALLIAAPVSIAITILLTEYMPAALAGVLGVIIDVAAGVPTVVFGVWAALALVPWLRVTAEPALQSVLGWIPIFSTPPIGYLPGQGIFAAGLVLAAMIFPTIVSVTRNSFIATPLELREASMGLGATRWETATRVVARQARLGVLGAIVLACGRALGEAMAIIFVIGVVPQVPHSLFDVGDTISTHLLTQVLGTIPGTLNISALYELGLILLALSLLTSLTGRLLTRRFGGAAAVAGGGR